MIIVDTSVWIDFFRGGGVAAKALKDLIRTERVALVGVVLAELLQGCRSAKEENLIISTFEMLPFLETDFRTWRRTGELSRTLRRRGVTLPLSDLIIASLGLEHDASVFTLDPHFSQIPGLKLYDPSQSGRKA